MDRNFRRYVVTYLIFTMWLTLCPASVPAQIEGLVPTTTSVEVSIPTSNVGQPVKLTALVTALGPEPGSPAGIVEFFSAGASLGTAELVATEDKIAASIEVTLPAGIHPIIAKYQGNATFAFSFSPRPVPHEVIPEPDSSPQ